MAQEIAVVLRYQAKQYPQGSFNEERLSAAAEICEREEKTRNALRELVEAERATMDQFTTAEIKRLEAALNNARAVLNESNKADEGRRQNLNTP